MNIELTKEQCDAIRAESEVASHVLFMVSCCVGREQIGKSVVVQLWPWNCLDKAKQMIDSGIATSVTLFAPSGDDWHYTAPSPKRRRVAR